MTDLWRQLSRNICSSKAWNWSIFLLLLACLNAAALLGSPPDRNLVLLQLPWETENHCEQVLGSPAIGSEQFRAYVFADFIGKELCTGLSQTTALGGHYRSVKAEWSLQTDVLSRLIFERHFALLQLRPEEALEAGGAFSKDYRRISFYSPYKVVLITDQQPPELNEAYLSTRRIGLLRNTKSRSGYRVPMQLFRNLGLELQQLQLKYYTSHEELRLALEKGDVDVISSYWDSSQREKFPNWHLLEIGGVSQGLNWFVTNEVYADINARCAVVKTLERAEGSTGNPYFAKLSFTPDSKNGCDEH
jgi:hypothetical protein